MATYFAPTTLLIISAELCPPQNAGCAALKAVRELPVW